MGVILKLAEDKYVEWSGVVDAPVSSVMGKKEVEEYLKILHSREEKVEYETDPKILAMKKEIVESKVKQRMERVETNGTSSAMAGDTMENTVAGNRAGPREKTLTVTEIIELYTYTPEKKGKFPFS